MRRGTRRYWRPEMLRLYRTGPVQLVLQEGSLCGYFRTAPYDEANCAQWRYSRLLPFYCTASTVPFGTTVRGGTYIRSVFGLLDGEAGKVY